MELFKDEETRERCYFQERTTTKYAVYSCVVGEKSVLTFTETVEWRVVAIKITDRLDHDCNVVPLPRQ